MQMRFAAAPILASLVLTAVATAGTPSWSTSNIMRAVKQTDYIRTFTGVDPVMYQITQVKTCKVVVATRAANYRSFQCEITVLEPGEGSRPERAFIYARPFAAWLCTSASAQVCAAPHLPHDPRICGSPTRGADYCLYKNAVAATAARTGSTGVCWAVGGSLWKYTCSKATVTFSRSASAWITTVTPFG